MRKDLTGNVYGKLTVIALTECSKFRSSWFECRCECGKRVVVRGSVLLGGGTKACFSCAHTKHGQSRTVVYRIWTNIKYRCYKEGSQSYHKYGARGITVCDRWLNSFENFIADLGPRPTPKHSVERLDNNSNYEPGNCKWATPKEQQNNTSMCRWIEYDGMTKTLSQWSDVIGVSAQVIGKRLDGGWSIEKSLTTPILDSKFKKGINYFILTK